MTRGENLVSYIFCGIGGFCIFLSSNSFLLSVLGVLSLTAGTAMLSAKQWFV